MIFRDSMERWVRSLSVPEIAAIIDRGWLTHWPHELTREGRRLMKGQT